MRDALYLILASSSFCDLIFRFAFNRGTTFFYSSMICLSCCRLIMRVQDKLRIIAIKKKIVGNILFICITQDL